MKLYFADAPLDGDAVAALDRLLIRNGLETSRHGVAQVRLPYVKPLPDSDGHFSLLIG